MDLLIHFLHHFSHLRRDIRPQRVIPLLTIGDDFGDFFVLLRRESKRVVKLLQKLFAQPVGLRLTRDVLRPRLAAIVILWR